MSPDDLRSFLQLLARADQLVRVTEAVDPRLELATVVDCFTRERGGTRALLFEQVIGSPLPVAANLFGTLERVGWALGTTDLEALAERFSADLAGCGEVDAGSALARLCSSGATRPVTVSAPAWGVNSHGASGLGQLPHITAWPGDGGPYLTLAQVFTRDPDGGAGNCGMYRVQLQGEDWATIRCRPQSGMAHHLAAWEKRGEAMPAAVVLGGPPAMTWAAGLPLPATVEEAGFCGYLTGAPVRMSECRCSDLQVPASAEVVIEGFVDPGVTRPEGPFGNHTGGYDGDPAAPVLRVVAVHTREEAICPWTLVGPPPRENVQLARATNRLLLPLVRMTVPTVRSLHMPEVGIYHRATLVSMDRAEDRPLAELARLLRSTLLLREARLLVLCADDHELRDIETVFWRILNRVDWGRDLLVENGALTVDARRVPPGEDVGCRPDILARVLARWDAFRID